MNFVSFQKRPQSTSMTLLFSLTHRNSFPRLWEERFICFSLKIVSSQGFRIELLFFPPVDIVFFPVLTLFVMPLVPGRALKGHSAQVVQQSMRIVFL